MCIHFIAQNVRSFLRYTWEIKKKNYEISEHYIAKWVTKMNWFMLKGFEIFKKYTYIYIEYFGIRVWEFENVVNKICALLNILPYLNWQSFVQISFLQNTDSKFVIAYVGSIHGQMNIWNEHFWANYINLGSTYYIIHFDAQN